MKVEIFNPETKETLTVDCADENIEHLTEKFKPITSKSKLDYFIDNLNIPAEAKALIFKVMDITITIGKVVLKIGIKIIESIVYLSKKYPSTTMGLIVGSVIGFLLSSIPILGWILSPIIFPLCVSLGLAVGFWEDLKDERLKISIRNHVDDLFGNLKDASVTA